MAQHIKDASPGITMSEFWVFYQAAQAVPHTPTVVLLARALFHKIQPPFVCYLLLNIPLHGARRAMAAALPLPRKPGQRRAFLGYTHFLSPNQKENDHSGSAPISFSPNPLGKRATQGKQIKQNRHTTKKPPATPTPPSPPGPARTPPRPPPLPSPPEQPRSLPREP